MNHSFNTEIADKYGIEEAIILENIYFWCKKNKANGQNIVNGKAWTYNSAKAFKELFHYMAESKIYRVLKRLESEGLIEIGCFNSNSYDRTKWYAITDKAIEYFEKSILQNEKSNLQEEQITIADINTDINTDIKDCVGKPPLPEEVHDFYLDNELVVKPWEFWNYNERKGWKIRGKPIGDWKSAYLAMNDRRPPDNAKHEPGLKFDLKAYKKR